MSAKHKRACSFFRDRFSSPISFSRRFASCRIASGLSGGSIRKKQAWDPSMLAKRLLIDYGISDPSLAGASAVMFSVQHMDKACAPCWSGGSTAGWSTECRRASQLWRPAESAACGSAAPSEVKETLLIHAESARGCAPRERALSESTICESWKVPPMGARRTSTACTFSHNSSNSALPSITCQHRQASAMLLPLSSAAELTRRGFPCTFFRQRSISV